MKIDKNNLRCLFSSWIRHDAELWGELRQIQIKLLYDRIVKEKNYFQMANEHNTSITMIRQLLKAIFIKVRHSVGNELANLLESINTYLEDVELGRKKPTAGFSDIFLN